MTLHQGDSNTDYILICQIAKGNRKAFHDLYLLYKDKVYNTAISYLQNVEDAEELTQDVFLAIFEKAYTFEGNSKVSTWIYRMTINKALNKIDKRNRQAQRRNEHNEHPQVDFKHPGVLLENQEKASYLFLAIDSLIASQKTAFILSYVEGLPQQEVASIMQGSLKSVESLLQRAKVNLRKKLSNYDPKENTNKSV